MKTLAGWPLLARAISTAMPKPPPPLGLEYQRSWRSGLYLISDLSSGVTGEVHFVDGGWHVATPPETLNSTLPGIAP